MMSVNTWAEDRSSITHEQLDSDTHFYSKAQLDSDPLFSAANAYPPHTDGLPASDGEGIIFARVGLVASRQ
jgi:hypothetical protein